MRFLSSVGAKQAPPGARAATRRSTAQPTYRMGKPYTRTGLGSEVDKFVADTFDRVTWVYKATDAVARNAARLKMICRSGDPEDGKEIDHALLPLLNFRTATQRFVAEGLYAEQSFVFRYRVSALLELSSRGVFIEVTRDKAGNPGQLTLLPSMYTKPIPDPLSFVSGYEVRIGADVATLPAENVLWIRNPHPIDPYRSMTPYEAAGIAIDTDFMAHVYNLNFMRNDGRPGTLVAVKGGLEDDAADELAAYFMGGPGMAGMTRVIESDGIEVADLATTPREAQYIEMRGLSKEEIFIAAGVPESVAGNASGRTFDNADAEKETFWQEKMLGHLELVGGAYDLIDSDPTTFIVHDTSKVDALQRAAIARRQEWRDEVDRGERTVNEYRKATGEKVYDSPLADVPWVSAGSTPMFRPPGEPAPVAPARPALAVVPPPPAPPANGSTPPVPAEAGAPKA